MNASNESDSETESAEPIAEGDSGLPDEEAQNDAADEVEPASEARSGSKPLGIVAVMALALLAGAVGGSLGFFAAQTGISRQNSEPSTGISAAVESKLGQMDQAVSTLSDRVGALDADLASRPAEIVQKPVDLSPVEASIADLQNRVAALDTTVSDLKQVMSQDGVSSDPAMFSDLNATIDALRQSITALEEDLPGRIAVLESSGVSATLESKLEAFVTKPDHDALATRLSLLEANPTADLAKQAALALSLANLVRSVELGKSFEAELDTLAALAPRREAVSKLRPMATQGLKRPDRLLSEFDALARQVIIKDKEVPDATWWQHILMRLRALVTIRPVGEVEGATTEAILARAELRMGEGDLRSAVLELRQLSGPGAVILQDWLDDAEARVQTEDLLQGLSAQILRDLSQVKG